MPLHQRPCFSPRHPAPPQLLHVAHHWAQREYELLKHLVDNSCYRQQWHKDFTEGAIVHQAFFQFAERVIHTITYRQDKHTKCYVRRSNPLQTSEKRKTRELRFAKRVFSFLSSTASTPRHFIIDRIDPFSLLICLRQEYAEAAPSPKIITLDGQNILHAKLTRRDPASMFHSLFSRRKSRDVIMRKRTQLNVTTARQLPPRFLERNYELNGEQFAVFNLDTAAHLQIAGAVCGHCVGNDGWQQQVLKGKSLILAVSGLLPKPTSIAKLNPSSLRACELKDLEVCHHTVATIEVALHNNACHISQCKLHHNKRVQHDTQIYDLLFRERILADIYRELVKRYGRVTGFGADFRDLKKPGTFLTVDGRELCVESLREDHVIVAGDVVKVLPKTTTLKHLKFLTNLSNIALDCTLLLEDDTAHSRQLCASISKIRGELVYRGRHLVLTKDRFPSLRALGSVHALSVETCNVDLPLLSTMHTFFVRSAMAVTFNAPALLRAGNIDFERARSISLHAPSLAQMGYLDVRTVNAISLSFPALKSMGDLCLANAMQIALSCPELLTMGDLTASSARRLVLQLPRLVEMQDLSVNKATSLNINFPRLQKMGELRAASVEDLDVTVPLQTQEHMRQQLRATLGELLRSLNERVRFRPANDMPASQA